MPSSDRYHKQSVQSESENTAISALQFVANDNRLLRRFLDLTGLSVDNIRHAAKSPVFFRELIYFILNHPPTAQQFFESTGITPAALETAARHFVRKPGTGG